MDTNPEKNKEVRSETENLLFDIKLKETVHKLVDDKIKKFLDNVKWVIGIFVTVLAFFGWSTIREMRDELRDQVTQQIKTKIDENFILNSLQSNLHEFEQNLVTDNIGLRVSLYNENKLQLIGDNDIIRSEYGPVVRAMLQKNEANATTIISVLNRINKGNDYLSDGFFGAEFNNIRAYVDSAIKNTDNEELKHECIKFLINFSINDEEKFGIIMENLDNSKGLKETYSLLPKIAAYFQSAGTDEDASYSQRERFIKFCKKKIRVAKKPEMLVSAYLTATYLTMDNDDDIKRIRSSFYERLKNDSLSLLFRDALDFLLKFRFLIDKNSLGANNAYARSLEEFLCTLYKNTNTGISSDYEKSKLLSIAYYNRGLYASVFDKLITDRELTELDKMFLIHTFSVGEDADAQSSQEFIPYCQVVNNDTLRIGVNLREKRLFNLNAPDKTVELKNAGAVMIRFEKNPFYNYYQ